MIENIQQIIASSVNYIAKETNIGLVHAMDNYLLMYNHLAYKAIQRKQHLLTEEEHERLQISAIPLTGRYCRMLQYQANKGLKEYRG